MLATTYPILDIFWTMLEVFLFFIWIYLIFVVFLDIFRSHDLGGMAKALWVIGLIIFPFLGVFIYLIARGGKMHERAAQAAQAQQQAFNAYVQETAGSSSARPIGQAGRPEGEGRADRGRVRRPKGQDPRLGRLRSFLHSWNQ